MNITEIEWVKKTEFMDDFISSSDPVTESKLPEGLEAEVVKWTLGTKTTVVKIWNKGSNADVEFQYSLLQAFKSKGIPVSVPFGYGYYNNFKVLATSFDGAPVQVVEKQHLHTFATLLREIHNFPMEFLHLRSLIRKFDFIKYFFPGIAKHPDLDELLQHCVKEADLKQDQLIHGDFNLGNILEHQGKFTVIDWTNAQLGDSRYDLAWAAFLIRIYNGEELHRHFLNSYFDKSRYSETEFELFEAIACLRWILLNRFVTIPTNEHTAPRLNHLIDSNCWLNRELNYPDALE